MRLLDLFCGRWGWSRAFAARGWECYGVDLQEPSEVPNNCKFWKFDALTINPEWLEEGGEWHGKFDFILASPPCEQFSVHGLKMWHINPPFPVLGVELFQHARKICETAGVPYVIENVRSAQQFVGSAKAHCGPFYLWGNAVPPLLIQGITKGSMLWSKRYRNMKKSQRKAEVATIPPELANCVAEYAERILEQRPAPLPECAP